MFQNNIINYASLNKILVYTYTVKSVNFRYVNLIDYKDLKVVGCETIVVVNKLI